MSNIFSGSEIVELGIQIEKNGKDFYNTLASQSKNQAAAQTFKFLAQEEQRHILIFKNILKKTKQYEPPQIYADEYLAYMNTLASEYVFTQKDKGLEIAKKITSDKEAVDIGIGFEKDSIIFYKGIKKAVLEYEQAVVDDLIKQEDSHLRQLLNLKNNL